MLAALPPGWSLLGRCRFGTAGPVGEASGCHALAHPGTGIVLVDIAPDVTPNAEARLRRALSAADFWSAFPGAMPVWHGRIELGEVRLLPAILAEGFSTLPPLTVPGKAAWVAAVQDALAEDPAWEVPGRPPRILPPPLIDDEEEDAGPPPRRRGRVMRALAVAGIGALALAGGMLLWGEAPPPLQTAESAPPAAPPVLAALPQPQQRPPEVVAPALPRIEQVSLPELALPAATVAPVLDEPALGEPVLGEPDPQPPEAPVEAAAAMPEPPPPPPPPRRVSAPRPPRIDPGCSAALFRFQQGLPMSAADAAHVRNGCATRW